ncbi:HTTM domain-containing protein [Streptomyces caniscabiei]|nr:HTTM domain-containing protein [Streptomyces caniscabiei]MDX3516196.1 HTTM domain-containing protein [Streptomyces caniscabiei]
MSKSVQVRMYVNELPEWSERNSPPRRTKVVFQDFRWVDLRVAVKAVALIDSWSTHPRSILGVSGMRALLGFIGFMFYASQYGDRHYLFGPDSILPWRDFTEQLEQSGTFSLYAFSDSDAWFELTFHVGMVLALGVALGFGGRLVLAAHWVFLWSIFQRQHSLLDGGDNLAYVVIPMLLLTRCYDHFSISTGVARWVSERIPGAIRSLSIPPHNLGVLAIALQITLVYVTSGLYKVQGRLWQDGTALFHIMRVPEFTYPGVSNLVYENDFIVVAGTYATTLFMVYFPLGILVPALRPWTASVSIVFHLSIAIFMGLTSFALTMVACDLIFLSGAMHRGLAFLTRSQGSLLPVIQDRLGWPKSAPRAGAAPVSAENVESDCSSAHEEWRFDGRPDRLDEERAVGRAVLHNAGPGVSGSAPRRDGHGT